MEDSHLDAPSENQGLQFRKDEQAARKNRSDPPRLIFPSAVLHPCCRSWRTVGYGYCSPKPNIPTLRAVIPKIPEKVSEETGVGVSQERRRSERNRAGITVCRNDAGS